MADTATSWPIYRARRSAPEHLGRGPNGGCDFDVAGRISIWGVIEVLAKLVSTRGSLFKRFAQSAVGNRLRVEVRATRQPGDSAKVVKGCP